MKVLVTAASKHGATLEIALKIEEVLVSAGLEATVVLPERVTDLMGYDAVVLGSAVYTGHWLAPAKLFVSRNLPGLQARPVWLFSSGPIDDSGKSAEEPVDVARIREATGAREHRLFSGRLAKRDLGFGEKAILSLIRVPEGDFRSWTEIEAWAMAIARTLKAEEAASRPLVAAG
jgi:menaquinone-dependent protoporphyrinogen oxidase